MPKDVSYRQRSWSRFGKQVGAAGVGAGIGFASGGPVGAVTGAYRGYQGMAKNNEYHNFKSDSGPSTGNIRSVTAKRSGSKLSKRNTGKKIKVSSSLRKKIGKVIEEKKVHGSWTQISYGYVDRPTANAQQCESMQFETTKQDHSGGWSFGIEDFLHAASVLFNNKTDSQGARGWADLGNLGITSTGEGNPAEKRSYGCNAKFTVQKSYVTYLLKNNTQSAMTITAWIVAPKTSSVFYQSATNDSGGVATAQYMGLYDPVSSWADILGTDTGRNISNSDIFRLGMKPTFSPEWKKAWSSETVDIVLEPGQSHLFNVAGPSQHQMDYTKFFRNNLMHTVQKFSRYVFFTLKTDLLGGAGTDADQKKTGRFKIDAPGKLCIERTFKCKISIPESTGTITGGAFSGNAAIENVLRRTAYCYYVYNHLTPADISRIDEVQPATEID